MGANTKIEWCDFTFNPWRGCQKVAAGCVNCYAEAQSKRNPKTLGVWGPNGTRVVASESMWRQPLGWNKVQHCYPQIPKPRVFCGSLCDVFEDWGGRISTHDGGVLAINFFGSLCDVFEDWGGIVIDSKGRPVNPSTWAPIDSEVPTPVTLDYVRARLFRLIDETPSLDWLLLTKRPENVRRMWQAYFPGGYIAEAGSMNQEGPRENLWLGVSIACRDDLKNLSELRKCKDLAAKIFVSAEPLIEDLGNVDWSGIGWVIVGGESGSNARPCDIAWIRSIVRQCKDAGVPCFVKQLGSSPIGLRFEMDEQGRLFCVECNNFRGRARPLDPKGGDPAEWPEDVRVREVPT